jgi:hypothetical protein
MADSLHPPGRLATIRRRNASGSAGADGDQRGSPGELQRVSARGYRSANRANQADGATDRRTADTLESAQRTLKGKAGRARVFLPDAATGLGGS